MATTLTDPNAPGGLLSVATAPSGVTGYNAAQATASKAVATGYDPQATSVAPESTVQGQVNSIIAGNSPLMQQATRRANEQANQRGLLNSSMAVGAGQSALYDAAMPMAQQDASTYFTAQQKTVDAQNAARNFGAAASNQASLANAQLGTDVSKVNAGWTNEAAARGADASNQAALAERDIQARYGLAQQDIQSRQNLAQLDASTRLQLQQMDASSRASISATENQYRQLLQANTNAASMYSQAVAAIGNISTNNNLSQAAKDMAISTQLNMLNEALRTTQTITQQTPQTVTGLNLSQFFNSDNVAKPTPQQIASLRAPYQAAVDNAYAAIPRWPEDYNLVVAPPGPNQSERTQANFNALYQQRYQEWQNAVAAMNTFNAQYA